MTANFWASSHCTHWQLSPEEVAATNPGDRPFLSEKEIEKISLYYIDLIKQLAQRIGLRQIVVGVSSVYFKRFYIRNSFIDYDANLLAPTCLFLAAKVTECNTHARVIEKGMQSLDCDWPFTMEDLLEHEYYVLEEMDFYLIIYQPYEPLVRYIPDAGVAEECLETAWHTVNDSFKTAALLVHPPHIIALGAILMAGHHHAHDLRAWFTELNVDMALVWDVVERLMRMYDLWDEVTEHGIDDLLAKLHRARSQQTNISLDPSPTQG